MLKNDPSWKDYSSIDRFKNKFLNRNSWYEKKKGNSLLSYILTILPVQILLAIIHGIIGGFTIQPILTYHLIFLLFNFSWLSLLAFPMILIVGVIASQVALCFASAKENVKLLRYISKIEGAGIKLMKYDLSDYIPDSDTIRELRHFYSKDESKKPETIGTVFFLEHHKKLINVRFKAFTITNYPNPQYIPNYRQLFSSEFDLPRSYVFTRFKPESHDVFKDYSILHEIGHTTEDAQDVEEIAIHHIISTLLFPMQIAEQTVPAISAKPCHSYRSKPCHSYRSKVCQLS